MKIFQFIRGRREPEYFHYGEEDDARGWVKPASVAGVVAFLLLMALLLAQFAGIDGGGLVDASRSPSPPERLSLPLTAPAGTPAGVLEAGPADRAAAVNRAMAAGFTLHADLVEPVALSTVTLVEARVIGAWLDSRPEFMAELPARFVNWLLSAPAPEVLDNAFAGVDGTNLSTCAGALGTLQILTPVETGQLILWLQAQPPLPPGVEGQKFARELDMVQAQCSLLGL